MDVSCEACVIFHHVSHKATPATDHAIRKSTQHDTSKVLCLRRKMNMEVSQSGASHEKCKSSSESDAKVLRLSHGLAFDNYAKHVGMSQCAMLPHETMLRHVSNHFFSRCYRHGHSAIIANGCGRLRTAKQRRANTSQPQTPKVNDNPLPRFREKSSKINVNVASSGIM
jgi:hypothetical protein